MTQPHSNAEEHLAGKPLRAESTASASSLPGRSWLTWLPSLLLVTVALLQIGLAKGHLLSPWKGGGFGMFSTMDSIGQRPLKAFVELPGRRQQIVLSPEFSRAHVGARGWPTDRALRKVAASLVEEVREQAPRATAIVVEVWRTRFEPQTSSLRYYRWRAVRWPLEDRDTTPNPKPRKQPPSDSNTPSDPSSEPSTHPEPM